ncbi:hypothetical protein ASG54_08355 [Aureimonas sp. Leaf460]|nr:hypothetical protein ASG62_22410 [Aureimonas sp. Leaf427]KQT80135.1 hypothetical protein ASG54_08355 [Aureimonas sp. Leaf460]
MRPSRALQALARDAGALCEIGGTRPPRGAARGLEAHGRRFRPQQTEGETDMGREWEAGIEKGSHQGVVTALLYATSRLGQSRAEKVIKVRST